ncbi:Histone deacetylase complex subunit SAP18 [Branchiostoma belcheri]|nr:Histone deacetylase complex subunit SAP18 [Branchiostoma belcheri]
MRASKWYQQSPQGSPSCHSGICKLRMRAPVVPVEQNVFANPHESLPVLSVNPPGEPPLSQRYLQTLHESLSVISMVSGKPPGISKSPKRAPAITVVSVNPPSEPPLSQWYQEIPRASPRCPSPLVCRNVPSGPSHDAPRGQVPSGRVKMAEGGREAKGGVFAKSIKRATRAKERFLQSIGKAEKSEKDETFEDYVGNFNNQQAAAVKLQKELKNYANSVKAMSLASKNLNDALSEAYGDDWPDKDEVRNAQDSMDLLWSDYQEKVTREVLSPVNTYQSQFPEVKQRIAKRGRKLVDYDAAKHTLTAAQQSKKRDEAKLHKAQDECQKAKKVYDDVNNGLMEELPALHDSRIGFYVSTFQALFSSEQRFHTDMGQLKSRLGDTLEKLQQEANTGKFATKRLPRSPGPASPSMAEVVEAAMNKPSLQNDTDHPYESVDLHGGNSPQNKARESHLHVLGYSDDCVLKNGEVDVNIGKPKLPSGEIEGPSAKVPGMSVKGPSLATPSFSAPSFNPPSVNAPSVKSPAVEVNTPSVGVEKPKLPSGSINGPDVDINAPDFSVNAPSLSKPDLSLKGPNVSGPDLKMPNLKGPDVDLKGPDVKMPGLKGPSLSAKMPDLSGPSLEGPQIKGGLKGPDVKAPEVDVNLPGVKAPDVSLGSPDVKGPSVKAPDLSMKMPDIKAPSVKAPDLSLKSPDIKGPNIKAPDLSLKSPDIKGPNIKAPDVSFNPPDIKGPNIKGPDISLPKSPDISLPKGPDVSLSNFKGPDISLPNVKGPDISLPKGPDLSVKGPEAKLPDVSLKADTPSASINGPNVSLNGPDMKAPTAEEPSLLEEISANIPGWSSVQVGDPEVKASVPDAKLSAKGPSLSAEIPEEPPYATVNKARKMAAGIDVPEAEVEATVDPGKVITTHSYTRCDSDELSFQTGETIHIIPFEDPDDADEGWLMGVKESDSSKGLLPENHTKRIQT